MENLHWSSTSFRADRENSCWRVGNNPQSNVFLYPPNPLDPEKVWVVIKKDTEGDKRFEYSGRTAEFEAKDRAVELAKV